MNAIKPIEINTRVIGRTAILTLKGHISTAESQVLSESLDAVICDNFATVVVDMADVEIITSDGLGALIRARKAASEAGGQLILSGLRGNIRDLFKMTRLDKIFTIVDSVDGALAAASN